VFRGLSVAASVAKWIRVVSGYLFQSHGASVSSVFGLGVAAVWKPLPQPLNDPRQSASANSAAALVRGRAANGNSFEKLITPNMLVAQIYGDFPNRSKHEVIRPTEQSR
jgi:hypothetical protein